MNQECSRCIYAAWLSGQSRWRPAGQICTAGRILGQTFGTNKPQDTVLLVKLSQVYNSSKPDVETIKTLKISHHNLMNHLG